MAATPFRPISWNENDLISPDKMGQLANNAQWLFENKPNVNYNAHSVRRTIGVKIMCGITTFTTSVYGSQTRPVYFSNFFSTGSKPIVTTGIVSFQRKIHVIHNGFGVMFPDHRGMEIIVECSDANNKRRIERTFWVTWMAMGY